jgi:hypothetical protein
MPKMQWSRKTETITRWLDSYNQRLVLEAPLKGFNRTLLKVKPNTKFWIALSDVELSD